MRSKLNHGFQEITFYDGLKSFSGDFKSLKNIYLDGRTIFALHNHGFKNQMIKFNKKK